MFFFNRNMIYIPKIKSSVPTWLNSSTQNVFASRSLELMRFIWAISEFTSKTQFKIFALSYNCLREHSKGAHLYISHLNYRRYRRSEFIERSVWLLWWRRKRKESIFLKQKPDSRLVIFQSICISSVLCYLLPSKAIPCFFCVLLFFGANVVS